MAESTEGSQTPQQIAQQAKALLAEIQNLKTRCETAATESESFRQKADSEAAFAFNAKGVCEEHAKIISGLKGNVESEIQFINSGKQKVDEAVASVNAVRASSENDSKIVHDYRRENERLASDLTAGTQKAQENLAALDTVNQSLQSIRTQIEDGGRKVAEIRVQSEQASQTIASNVEKCTLESSEITQFLLDTKTSASEVKTLSDSAKSLEQGTKAVADRLNTAEASLRQYEDRIQKLLAEAENRAIQIDKLLPGATSVGLASAFNTQRERFATAQSWWFWIFVGCIGLLVLISIPSFIMALQPTDPRVAKDYLKDLLLRLPIAIPLVWLAIYSGRNYMLSLRVEEDYAYKETISRSFEGYRREMENIGAGDSSSSPLNTLCVNILSALAERPGRIYEGRVADITPLTEAMLAAEKAQSIGSRGASE